MKEDVVDTLPKPEEVAGMEELESERILVFFKGAQGASDEWEGQGAHRLVDCGATQTSFSGSERILFQSEVN